MVGHDLPPLEHKYLFLLMCFMTAQILMLCWVREGSGAADFVPELFCRPSGMARPGCAGSAGVGWLRVCLVSHRSGWRLRRLSALQQQLPVLCRVFWAPTASSNGTSLRQLTSKPKSSDRNYLTRTFPSQSFSMLKIAVFLGILLFSSVKYEL